MRFIIGLFLCLTFLASAPASAWRITNYVTRMNIQPDSSIIVEEEIHADFTGTPKHGIYRDIPLSGKDRYGNNYRIKFALVSVTDPSGNRITSNIAFVNGRYRIKIGDANRYVDGPISYVIRYRLQRAIRFFQGHDELYWNVIGPEWEVPIERASCVVTLPSDVAPEDLQTASYTGAYGYTTSDAESASANNRSASFNMTRQLNPGEYMTVVVGWPKGIVAQAPIAQRIIWFALDNGFFFVPFIFIGLFTALWWKLGRDPDTGRSEMVAYDPPEGLSPSEIGVLIDEKADIRDISASIIDLAVRGYLTIETDVKKSLFSTKTDYRLELTKPAAEVEADLGLSEFDRKLIKGLFDGAQSRWMSSLDNHFYTALPGLRDNLYNELVLRGYFSRRPDTVRNNYHSAGAAIAVGGLILTILFAGNPAISIGWGIAIGLCGLILLSFARVMPKKTVKGKNALLQIKGFEEYLSRAEREFILYQERQDYFEKFLPYAMALGIADKWAKAFEGLQNEPPGWYRSDAGIFSASVFAHDLGIASRSWGNTMTSVPRSEGGGSSFFGGGSGFSGGSSGGGGGGGGGGSW